MVHELLTGCNCSSYGFELDGETLMMTMRILLEPSLPLASPERVWASQILVSLSYFLGRTYFPILLSFIPHATPAELHVQVEYIRI